MFLGGKRMERTSILYKFMIFVHSLHLPLAVRTATLASIIMVHGPILAKKCLLILYVAQFASLACLSIPSSLALELDFIIWMCYVFLALSFSPQPSLLVWYTSSPARNRTSLRLYQYNSATGMERLSPCNTTQKPY